MKYVIRQPGCTAWATDIRTMKEAKKEYRAAQDTGIEVRIYREMADGNTYEICPECADELTKDRTCPTCDGWSEGARP